MVEAVRGDAWTDSERCASGSLVKVEGPIRRVYPATCRTWNCPGCGPRKGRQLAARISRCPGRRMITLTWRPRENVTPKEALDELNHAWRTIWKRIKRAQGEDARGYVRIVEVTKAGWPHLHILVQCRFVHVRTLSRWMGDLTNSPIVDARAIKKASDLSRYVSKYLTKQAGTLAGRRRWSATPRWLPPPPTPTLEPGQLPPKWRYDARDPVPLTVALILGGATRLGDYWLMPEEHW